MRTTSVLVGMVFGALAGGLLILPLAIEVPARLVSGWWFVSHDAALVAFVLALFLPVVAGFVAAWLDPDDPIRAGAGAAIVGALLCGTTVAMPATQVSPLTDLALALSDPRVEQDRLRDLLFGALVGAEWVQALTATSLLVATPALGAIGGLVHDLWQGRAGRVSALVHRSSVPLVAAWVVLGTVCLHLAWTAHADVTLFPRIDHPLSYGTRGRLTAGLGTVAVAQALLLAWMLRDALLLVRARRRLAGAAWALLALAPTALTGVAVLALHPLAAVGPAFLGGGVLLLGTVLGTAVVHRASEAELHERPRTFWDLLGEGSAMGVVTVGLASFCGLTPILGAWLVGLPLVRRILAGGPMVEVETLLEHVYLAHLAAPIAMAIVAALYGVLAMPMWIVARALFARASRREP